MKIRDIELYVEDTDQGDEVVLFIHGLLWSAAMFEPQIEALRTQYRCIAYDHRGQGRSEVPATRSIDMDTLYEDAVALIEALDVAPVHVVGLSMGGFVGMRLAARRPDLVRSLTLIATAPDAEDPEKVGQYRTLTRSLRLLGARPIAGRVAAIMFGDTFLKGAPRARRRHWVNQLKALPRSIYKAVNGVTERVGVADELSAIRCPTLILHGDEDRAISRQRALLAHDGIAGSIFVPVPCAGHTTTIENDEVVTAALRVFLASAS